MGDYQRSPKLSHRDGFTLIEILIVMAIISILMAGLGVTISKMATQAKEAQTIATLRKIDGLIIERMQGLERAYDGRDFRLYIERIKERLVKGDPANGVPQLHGLADGAVAAAARKDFARDFFPQRFLEMTDVKNSSGQFIPDGVPDKIQFDEVYRSRLAWGVAPAGPLAGTTVPFKDLNGNGALDPGEPYHDPVTQSSALLYFALTRLEIFGVPAVGTDAFLTQEVADTDGDGMPEFVDGWGRPLRFYRWPTRLFKPYGLFGADQQPGIATVDDNGNGAADVLASGALDHDEIGWPGSDDVVIPPVVRQHAGYYFRGLPRPPVTPPPPLPPVPVLGDYDLLNEDPDDPYGALMAEVKRMAASGIFVLQNVSESRYHTLDTFHKPLVVSAGEDGYLGLYEPFHNEDLNFNGILDSGEDANGNGRLDIGLLAQPLDETAGVDQNGNGYADSIAAPVAALDDLTNRNRRAGE